MNDCSNVDYLLDDELNDKTRLHQRAGFLSVYGKRGNLSKSGFRFSLKASRPSLASSVV